MKSFFCLTLFWCFFLLAETSLCQQPFNNQRELEYILEKLFRANGNYSDSIPKIEIVDNRGMAASYNHRQEIISIERKALAICNQLTDRTSAIAFLIGHELTHAYQYRKNDRHQISGFLSYSKAYPASIELEKTADIQGGFLAYLAGYNINIIPQLLAELYEVYELKGKSLPDYPTYSERLQTNEEVLRQLEQLIHAYETANYLSILGAYDLAIAHYRFILSHYHGADIHNNLGLVYTLKAMNIGGKKVDDYLLPIELDLDSRLKRPRAQDLSAAEKMQRIQLLSDAAACFNKNLALNPNHFPSQLNKLCVFILKGQYQHAIQHYQSIPYSTSLEKDKLQLALATAYLYIQPTKGTSLLVKLQQSKNKLITAMAKYNLAIAQETQVRNEWLPENCYLSLPKNNLPIKRSLPNSNLLGNSSAVQLGWEKVPNGEVMVVNNYTSGYHFYVNRSGLPQSQEFDIQHFNSPTIQSQNDFLVPSPACKVILKVTPEGKVTEWVKYYHYSF